MASPFLIIITMTISPEDVEKDFYRFIRHEAMRANCLQENILTIINNTLNGKERNKQQADK